MHGSADMLGRGQSIRHRPDARCILGQNTQDTADLDAAREFVGAKTAASIRLALVWIEYLPGGTSFASVSVPVRSTLFFSSVELVDSATAFLHCGQFHPLRGRL